MAAPTIALHHSRVVSRSPVYYGWVVWAVATLCIIASAPGQAFTISLFLDHYIADFFGISGASAALRPFDPLGGLLDVSGASSGGRTLVSTLFSLGTIGAGLSLTWVGRQIDRRGNRRVGTVAAVLMAGALLFSAFINGPIMLLLSFFMLRLLGMGTLFLVGTTAIARWWMLRRGWVMGLALVGFALFQRVYLPLLEEVISAVGWRTSWVILAAGVGLLFVPLWALLMRDTPEQFGLLPDGAADAPAADVDAAPNLAMQEQNYTLPQVRRLPIFWIFMLGRFAPAMMGSGLIFHLVSVFAEAGHGAAVAASTYGTVALVNAGMTLVAGRMIRRIRPGVFMAAQLAAMILALLLSQVMTADWLLLPFAMTFGTVMAFGATFDGTVWADLFGRLHHGAIRGFAATALVFGTATGPVIWGLSYDLTGSYWPVIGFGIAFILMPLTASLFTDHPRPLEAAAQAGS